MKIIFYSFFVLFTIVIGIDVTTQDVFADREIIIKPATGSGAPGCEIEFEGCFIPSTATVDVGGSVIFSNTDSVAHTFTSGSTIDGLSGKFDTGIISPGATYEWIPDITGIFDYFCMVHPWMIGEIIVQEKIEQDSSNSRTTNIIESRFAQVSIPPGSSVPGCEETNECYIPSIITIQVGTEVTWSNDDTAAHTVTGGNSIDGPSGKFDSSLFFARDMFSVTFYEVGTYSYFCMVHPWMQGVIEVIPFDKGGGEDSNPIPIPETFVKSITLFIADSHIVGEESLNISGKVEPIDPSEEEVKVYVANLKNEQIYKTDGLIKKDGTFTLRVSTGGSAWDDSEGELKVIGRYSDYRSAEDRITYEKGPEKKADVIYVESTDYSGLVVGLVAVAVVVIIMSKKKGKKKIPTKSLKDSKLKD